MEVISTACCANAATLASQIYAQKLAIEEDDSCVRMGEVASADQSASQVESSLKPIIKRQRSWLISSPLAGNWTRAPAA